jgi:hypothetical protein
MFGELSLFKFQQSHELCWMYGKSEFPCRRSCVHDQEVDLTMALPRHLLVSPFSTTKIASTRRLVFNTLFFPFSGIWIRDDQSEAIYDRFLGLKAEHKLFCNLFKMCIYYLRNAISCGSRFKSNDFLQRLFQFHKFAMICTDMNSQVASCPSQLHPSYPCLKKMTYRVYTLKPKEMVSNFEIMFSCLPKWCNTINCKLCIHVIQSSGDEPLQILQGCNINPGRGPVFLR